MYSLWNTKARGEIDDLPVVRIRRIEREEHAPRDSLVRASGTERRATRDRRSRVDDNADDAGFGSRGNRE